MPKIDQNDPRLTAYALDEMSPAERAAFEPLLRDDPAARALVDDLGRIADLLADALAAEPLPARTVVLPAARRPHWLRRLVADSWTLWVPLGAVACFALFFWRVYLPGLDTQQPAAPVVATGPSGVPPGYTAVEVATTTGEGSAVGGDTAAPRSPLPSAPTGLTAASTIVKTGHFLTARENPSSQFAVNVGTAAYADVRRSLEAGERPPTTLVRIEELVNAFPYRYPRPAGADALALATEMHSAPWAKDHLLVRIALQGRDTPAPATTAATAPTGATPPAPAGDRPSHAARELLAADAAAAIRSLAARDVKVQVDFNPEKVLAYRLIGYENRLIKSGDAEPSSDNNLAAGRAITALYEVIPLPPPAAAPRTVAAQPVPPPTPDPSDTAAWLTVKLRYADPATARSRSVIVPLHAAVAADTPPASPDFQFAAAVAGFGLILQNNPNRGTASWDMVEELAQAGLADDTTGRRKEFVSLVKKARVVAPAETTAPAITPAPTEPVATP